MSSTIRAVIFDRDDVLTYFDLQPAIDFISPLISVSVEQLAEIWEAWGQEIGYPTNAAEEVAFWLGYWDRLSDTLNVDEEIREQLKAFDYTAVIKPYQDARPALEQAREQGVSIGVLSNFNLATIDASLAAAELADLVDVACAAPVIGAAKPDPAAYLHIAGELNLSPDECMFFDDDESNVLGARQLGMQAYLVNRKNSEHDLSRGVVRDLSVVPSLIQQPLSPLR